MPTYVVQGRDPRRIATAVVLYQLRQPRFAFALVAVLAAFATAGAFSGLAGSRDGVMFAQFVMALVTEYKRRQLAFQLGRRGFRPGSTIEATAEDDALTVAGNSGRARYPWAQMEQIQMIRAVVLFRLRPAQVLVAVPVVAMPGCWSERVALKRRRPSGRSNPTLTDR